MATPVPTPTSKQGTAVRQPPLGATSDKNTQIPSGGSPENPETKAGQHAALADGPGGPDGSGVVSGRIIHAPSEQPGVPDEVMVLTAQGRMFKAAQVSPEITDVPSGTSATVTQRAGQARISDFDRTSAKTAFRAGNDTYRGNRTLHVIQVIPKAQTATGKTSAELHRLGRAVDDYYARESSGLTRFADLRVHPVTLRSEHTCEHLADLHHEVLRALGLPASWNGLNIIDKVNVIAVMPPYSSCPGGRAYVGYGFGYVTNGLTKTMIHEIGHQLGLRHAAAARCDGGKSDVNVSAVRRLAACTYYAYGDRYDVMGGVANLDNPAAMTPAHAQKLGFLATRVREIEPGAQYLPAYANQRAHVRALTFRDPKQRVTYHIFYRSRQIGQDKQYFQGLPGHSRIPQEGVVVTKTSWDNPWGQPILVLRQGAHRYWDQTLPLNQNVSFAAGDLVLTVTNLGGAAAHLHATVRGQVQPPPAKRALKQFVSSPGGKVPAGKQSATSHKVAIRHQLK